MQSLHCKNLGGTKKSSWRRVYVSSVRSVSLVVLVNMVRSCLARSATALPALTHQGEGRGWPAPGPKGLEQVILFNLIFLWRVSSDNCLFPFVYCGVRVATAAPRWCSLCIRRSGQPLRSFTESCRVGGLRRFAWRACDTKRRVADVWPKRPVLSAEDTTKRMVIRCREYCKKTFRNGRSKM